MCTCAYLYAYELMFLWPCIYSCMCICRHMSLCMCICTVWTCDGCVDKKKDSGSLLPVIFKPQAEVMDLISPEREILSFKEEWSLPMTECHQDGIINLEEWSLPRTEHHQDDIRNLEEGAQTLIDNPVRLSLISIKAQLILSEGKADNTGT